jgi:glycosyltransferase involved in cell wall biosynthesis
VRKALGPHDEIVVVDSASADGGIVREIGQAFGARTYRCEKPGASRARNLGIAHAGGEIVAFTDDDAMVDEGWLDALIAPFTDTRIGAVVGPVFQPGREPRRLLTEYAAFDAASERASFRKGDRGLSRRLRLGAIGSGANFAARRELFERHGGFKECLGAGAPIAGDEIFFLLSIVARGETVINEPSASVVHPVQLEPRYEQILQSRVAYWIYASAHHPLIAMRTLPGAIRRLRTQERKAASKGERRPGLLSAALRAPGLLLSAWRFSGWK